MPSTVERGCWEMISTHHELAYLCSYTTLVSRAASRSMGRTRRKKKIERMAKPLMVRVCIDSINCNQSVFNHRAYKDTTIHSKYCQLVQSCNQIPASSYIACDEDNYRDDGKRVHQRSAVALQNCVHQSMTALFELGALGKQQESV